MDTNTVAAHAPIATDTLGRRISARRHRSIEEKRAIVAEAELPGVSVAEVARRHGVNANLVFSWRRLHSQGLLESHTRRMTGRKLVPVKLLGSPVAATTASALRLEWPDGLQVHVAADADMAMLARVLELLRR